MFWFSFMLIMISTAFLWQLVRKIIISINKRQQILLKTWNHKMGFTLSGSLLTHCIGLPSASYQLYFIGNLAAVDVRFRSFTLLVLSRLPMILQKGSLNPQAFIKISFRISKSFQQEKYVNVDSREIFY